MWKNILLIVGSTVLWLGLLETGCWYYFDKVLKQPHNPRSVVDDDYLHHRWPKNHHGWQRVEGYRYDYYTNSESWLEKQQISREKPADTYRIFYIGDSNTEGLTEDKFKLSTIVGDRLNQFYKHSKTNIEVINTGTSSYSNVIYYILFKRNILPFDPDLIIVNVDMTDVPNDTSYRKSTLLSESGEPLRVYPDSAKEKGMFALTINGTVRIPWYGSSILYLRKNSYLIKFASDLFYELLPGPTIDPKHRGKAAYWIAHKWTETIKENVAYSMGILTRLIYLAKANNVKVMVTGVPHFYQYTGEGSTRPHYVLADTVTSAGARYLNSYEGLKPKVKGTEQSKYYYSKDPMHFNIRGNKIWSDIQYDFLISHEGDLIPKRSITQSKAD